MRLLPGSRLSLTHCVCGTTNTSSETSSSRNNQSFQCNSCYSALILLCLRRPDSIESPLDTTSIPRPIIRNSGMSMYFYINRSISHVSIFADTFENVPLHIDVVDSLGEENERRRERERVCGSHSRSSVDSPLKSKRRWIFAANFDRPGFVADISTSAAAYLEHSGP